MESETLHIIGTYFIPIITAITGWFAGTRKRKNSFLQDLQKSINLLSAENHRLLIELTDVNKQLVNLKKENEELKRIIGKLTLDMSWGKKG